MSLFTYIFKKAMPLPKIFDYNSFVFIGAHPDDIEFECAGTIAKLRKAGKKVSFIIVTDGRYGTQDPNITPDDLIKIRKEESILAAADLDVYDIRFLNFRDGGRYDVDKVADKLAVELALLNPDIVFTIDNHVKSEIHPDHLKVGRASELAFFRCSFPLMMKELGVNKTANPKGLAYYFTDSPNTFIKITDTFETKITSVSKHKSQLLSGNEGSMSIEVLITSFKTNGIRYGLRCFAKYAEGFRVLATNHLHCIPEASKF